MSIEMVKHLLSYEKLEGVILLTYGAGNAPTDEVFLSALEEKIASGIPVVNVTQCLKGSVSQGEYAVSQTLKEIGVISGVDMTKEAAITKMMYLLPRKRTMEEFRKLYVKDLRGEINTIKVK